MSNTFGPYTPVRRAGNTYYVSGQVGVDMTAKTAATDVQTQTRQALENMRAVLAGANLDLADVIKTTIYLADMDDFAAVNEVYQTFFDPPRPARSTIAIKDIPRVASDTRLLVEIEAVAYKEHA